MRTSFRQKPLQRFNVLIFCVLAGIPIGVFFLHPETLSAPNAPAPDAETELLSLTPRLQAYVGAHPETIWQLDHEPRGPDDISETASLLASTTARVERALSRNRSAQGVSELSDAMSGRLYATVYTSADATLALSRREVALQDLSQRMELCLVPRENSGARRLRGSKALYLDSWHALMLAAIDWSDEWFDAIVLHELSHAMIARTTPQSSESPMFSDPWIQEEAYTHDLESRVLTYRSNGCYSEALTAITEERPAATLSGFFASITTEDLLRLDRCFGSASQGEAALRAMQYLIDLARQKTLSAREPTTEEIYAQVAKVIQASAFPYR